jgi:capsular polysaccharide biosynthesis protein
VSDGDRIASPPPGASDDYDLTDADESPGGYAIGLVSLAFLRAALRRSRWLWRATAVAGFLVGLGIYVVHPGAYQASTTVVLVPNPAEQPTGAIVTDVALAESRTVAGRVVQKLGLHESAPAFLGSYTVTPVTDRVVVITVGAPSSGEAVARARTLAAEFLQFRAQQAQAQAQIELTGLQQQVTQAQQHIKSLRAQISQFATQPTSAAQQAKLTHLRAQLSQAANQLPTLEQGVEANEVSTRLSATQMAKGSQVLDPATPLPHSHYKKAILYAAGGTLAGLALGMAIVLIQALMSDHLRRRKDVADALGAPVKLSVGVVRVGHWLPSRRKLTGAQDRNMQRIVAYLRDAVPASAERTPALAIVAVDNTEVAAVSTTSLAASLAADGKHVVLADLCDDTPAARLLGTKDPGVRGVSLNGVHVVLAVPDDDNLAPVGPLRRGSAQTRHPASRELVSACASADLILTLVSLDPSLGADYLRTWADDAVVIVTAGRSSATRIHAVGEMIRIARTRLVSAVLIGADKTDESLGIPDAPISPTRAGGAGQDLPASHHRQSREGVAASRSNNESNGPHQRGADAVPELSHRNRT